MTHRDDAPRNFAIATKDLCRMRVEYNKGRLIEDDLAANPVEQFWHWLKDAKDCAEIIEPNACVLATCLDGKPSSRVVLIKEIEQDKFIFYTNYVSRKALEIESNPNVSLTFYWGPLERQVHVEGEAQKISSEKSDCYFKTRPFLSQVSAVISPQSRIIDDREALENKVKDYENSQGSINLVRPDYWGGFSVHPQSIEFWQGGRGRLHDRLKYIRDKPGNDDSWVLIRLAS